MQPSMLQALMTRLAKLERRQLTRRIATVTGVDPLSVTLAPPAIPYDNVRSVGPEILSIGQTVVVDVFGNDLFILGSLQAGEGAENSIGGLSVAPASIVGSAPQGDAVLPATLGGGEAGGHIVPATVDGGDLADSAVTPRELAENSVTGEAVAPGAVDGMEINEPQLRTVDGITFPEETGPVSNASIEWELTTGGYFARINGYKPSADGGNLTLGAHADDGVGEALAGLALLTSLPLSAIARFTVKGASATTFSRNVIDGSGGSDFVQVGANNLGASPSKTTRLVFGRVAANGTIAAAGSADWTVARTGGAPTGKYTITLTGTTQAPAPTSVYPAVLLGPASGTAILAIVSAITATTFSIEIYTQAGGLVDSAFIIVCPALM